MSAVFSAGVVARLQELNVHDDIEAVYSVSAGALNGAFFLTRQAHLLEPMYCEDFTSCQAINTLNIWSLWHGARKDVFDVDRALDVIMTKRVLDTPTLSQQPIPLYARVYNVGSELIEYLDARDHGVFPVLHATASLAPFYSKQIEINQQHYIDGAVRESIGLQHLLKQHPDKRIILVLNSPGNSLRNLMNKFVLRSLLRTMSGRYYTLFKAMEEDELEDLRVAFREERILLVQPPPGYAVGYTTTEKSLLRQGFSMGYREGDKIVRFMERQLPEARPIGMCSSVRLPAAV